MIIDHKPLPEKIAEFIRNQIIQGKLKSGEKILEAQIAEDLNISRTPVREAIRLLECEGFVELLPRRGAIVKEFSEKDFKDIVEIKACIESLAVELSYKKINEKTFKKLYSIIENEKKIISDKPFSNEKIYKFFKEYSKFQEIFFKLCDNNQLVDLNLKIENHIKRYRFYFLKFPEILKEIPILQENVISAIKSKDIKKIKDAYSEYIKKPYFNLIKNLKNEKN